MRGNVCGDDGPTTPARTSEGDARVQLYERYRGAFVANVAGDGHRRRPSSRTPASRPAVMEPTLRQHIDRYSTTLCTTARDEIPCESRNGVKASQPTPAYLFAASSRDSEYVQLPHNQKATEVATRESGATDCSVWIGQFTALTGAPQRGQVR